MDWKKIVGTVAPTIATALGGPLSGLATTAVLGALGLGDGADEDAILAALGNPEALAKIKIAEFDFKKRLKELEIDLEKVHAGDRDSARNMQTATRSKIPGFLAIVLTVGYFSTLYAILFASISPDIDPMLLGAMLGTMQGAWMLTLNFYFGTTNSSDHKNNIIAGMRK